MSGQFNFDHPSAFDLDLLTATLKRLKEGKSVSVSNFSSAATFEATENGLSNVQVPVYDFTTHSRVPDGDKTVYGANVIIFEGIMSFVSQELLEVRHMFSMLKSWLNVPVRCLPFKLMDLKVFVETDADERLARRLRRDIMERGRDLHSVLDQYIRFVKPAYEQFIAPSAVHADIVVPRGEWLVTTV